MPRTQAGRVIAEAAEGWAQMPRGERISLVRQCEAEAAAAAYADHKADLHEWMASHAAAEATNARLREALQKISRRASFVEPGMAQDITWWAEHALATPARPASVDDMGGGK